MTTTTPRATPYDPELAPVAAAVEEATRTAGHLSHENLLANRAGDDGIPLAERFAGHDVDVEDRHVPGPAGGPELLVTVIRPRGGPAQGGFYHIHGGGMIGCTRFEELHRIMEWVRRYRLVAVLPEYRLAPEHPHPAPVEDCYAGLCWTAENAVELGFDPDRLLVMGGSAGGGLSAALALLARDRGGPALRGQVLLCPMIDDRDETASTRQFDGYGPWNRTSNVVAWQSLLGERYGTDDVDASAAPSRAVDVSGLPPAYIEVGSAELFRDEDVAYASALWAAGVQAELHVWAGAFHGFEIGAPDARVSVSALAARDNWVERTLTL